ncbi:helix-turn-helix domain-containing protein [Ornithinimicrobium murale]|uniref:helix-turn-helix domain-containing protein n=1 Tax=Ornithinimicrobium murale TaxID=1050153 RepID=UPI0013B404AA|nr:helix-turn-helix domain-containing protein [Ornithinimicrobium murale]
MNTTAFIANRAASATTSDAAEATLLLTLDEVARELRCARRSVERQVAGDRLPVVHVGRSVRVTRHDLEVFVAGLQESSVEHVPGDSHG